MLPTILQRWGIDRGVAVQQAQQNLDIAKENGRSISFIFNASTSASDINSKQNIKYGKKRIK